MRFPGKPQHILSVDLRPCSQFSFYNKIQIIYKNHKIIPTTFLTSPKVPRVKPRSSG